MHVLVFSSVKAREREKEKSRAGGWKWRGKGGNDSDDDDDDDEDGMAGMSTLERQRARFLQKKRESAGLTKKQRQVRAVGGGLRLPSSSLRLL